MKKYTHYSIATLGLAALFLMGCGDKNQQSTQQSQTQASPFQVAVIPQKTVTAYSSYPTTIEGIINSDIRAKVSGYIQQVYVDEGQKVTKGQPLFKIETQSLSQDADAAKASVNVAQVEVDKLIPLVEKGIISNVQLETQKAKLAQAKSTYNSIVANIGYATVKSPVNGFVGTIPFREGSLVSATNAQPLTTVSDIKQVYAYFSMNETEYLNFIQKTAGKTLQDKVNNFPEVQLVLVNGQTYSQKGKIQTVTAQVDSKTGTVTFRAIFDNPNQLITNGNSGVIKVPTVYENAIVVPQTATFEQQGETFVYKVGDDNKAVANLISIKDKADTVFILDAGLQKGDKIVVNGLGKLRNNTPIQPVEVSFDSITKPIKKLFH